MSPALSMSTQRAAVAYKSVTTSPGSLLPIYAELAKRQLTVLNVLVTMSTFAVCPLPSTIPTLLATAVGTTLCSASANTLNQVQEIPFDAQMARTRNRPLVRHAISSGHASMFAIVAGVSGPVLLYTMVNPTTAILGLANVALYAGPYTWMKRKSTWNTSLGCIVGAVPPLMGWTACGGSLLPSETSPLQFILPFTDQIPPLDNPLVPFALFLFLYSWQFAHFNPLSHMVRASYAQAGYKMLSVLSPSKNRTVALRHALFLLPICSAIIPMSGVVTWLFAITSLPPNIVMALAAWKFRNSGSEKDARVLFRHSLWYLPVLFGLMMVHKQNIDWLEWVGISPQETREEEVVNET